MCRAVIADAVRAGQNRGTCQRVTARSPRWRAIRDHSATTSGDGLPCDEVKPLTTKKPLTEHLVSVAVLTYRSITRCPWPHSPEAPVHAPDPTEVVTATGPQPGPMGW